MARSAYSIGRLEHHDGESSLAEAESRGEAGDSRAHDGVDVVRSGQVRECALTPGTAERPAAGRRLAGVREGLARCWCFARSDAGTARFDNGDRECEPERPWRTRGRGIG